MQTQQTRNNAFRNLLAAIVLQALNDLTKKHRSMKMIDQDMAWILGADCESYCLVLDMDYTAIRDRAADYYRHNIPDLLEPPPPRVMSADTRAKISAALKGKPLSPAHKEKLRAAKLGAKQSPEHRNAISRANTGKKRSPEFSEHLRQINTGRKMTGEDKAKMSAAQRKRFDRSEERERARQNTLKRFSDPEERRKQAERTRAYAARRKQENPA